MSTTTQPTTRTTLLHPDPGAPGAILAHRGHPQHCGYPLAGLGISARIPLRRPTARVQRTLRECPTPLGVRLSTATPRELAGDITVGRAVELA
ncbi:MAG TPA: hypothetical protein VN748_14405 [Pseudonocardiaceae bacterium]|jgi:hypothetical protein|nr:hypothetical protein [Pseudonocardiaceae bacterium]